MSFLGDITIGQYYPAESVVHRLDPRTKITLTMVMVTAVFLAPDFWAQGSLAILTLLMVKVSGVPLSYLFRGLRPILIILAFTFVLNALMIPGAELARIGPLSISQPGVLMGLLLAIRLILLVAIASLLSLTTTPIDLTDGLEQILSPFRRLGVPAHELAMMMSIALRFVPTLLEEAEKIIKAQMARGADFESGNVIQRARAMVPVLVPLFVGAFRRADELALAMEARCYRGGYQRTRLKQLRFGTHDLMAGCAGVLLLLVLFLWRWW
ncbi:MAG TPA: energy-coupling factor transporter transmembrane protein EcfT [Firmicutes bacterium]|nr:energy-coupling factor transporter transmembrane protein EcfT [Bacillota bacterium]